jgi:hypothetical protein
MLSVGQPMNHFERALSAPSTASECLTIPTVSQPPQRMTQRDSPFQCSFSPSHMPIRALHSDKHPSRLHHKVLDLCDQIIRAGCKGSRGSLLGRSGDSFVDRSRGVGRGGRGGRSFGGHFRIWLNGLGNRAGDGRGRAREVGAQHQLFVCFEDWLKRIAAAVNG